MRCIKAVFVDALGLYKFTFCLLTWRAEANKPIFKQCMFEQLMKMATKRRNFRQLQRLATLLPMTTNIMMRSSRNSLYFV